MFTRSVATRFSFQFLWMVIRKLGRFVRVAIITFLISIGLTLLSRGFLSWLGTFSSFLLLLAIVSVGIVFDTVGVATTAAEERPFHAMAADKVAGAKEAVWLVRNADRVSSFTQDIVGDIAGTLSGAIGALIVVRIVAMRPSLNETLAATMVVAAVAAITVGGKAWAKGIAIDRRTHIVLQAGRFLHHLGRVTGLPVANLARRPRNNKKTGKGDNRGRRKRGGEAP